MSKSAPRRGLSKESALTLTPEIVLALVEKELEKYQGDEPPPPTGGGATPMRPQLTLVER
jgi:hypothetical protein